MHDKIPEDTVEPRVGSPESHGGAAREQGVRGPRLVPLVPSLPCLAPPTELAWLPGSSSYLLSDGAPGRDGLFPLSQ